MSEFFQLVWQYILECIAYVTPTMVVGMVIVGVALVIGIVEYDRRK